VYTIAELEETYSRERVVNMRAAAETAYALATRYRGEDVDGERRFDLAGRWAETAVQLLEELPSERLDQVVSTRASVGGVPLPELLHAQVARVRLADVLI
jgi:hypothetical protein